MTFSPAVNAPPPYQWDQFHDLLRRNPDGSVVYRAPNGNAFVAADGSVYLLQNATWNGASYLRLNPALPASLAKLDSATQTFQLFTAPAGTGAITWAGPTTLGADSGWQNAAFAANWSNGGGTTVQYKMDTTGRVWLKGNATKGVALALPDTIFTLPAAFRPATTHGFACRSGAGYTQINVTTAGLVQVASGGSAAGTGLDNIAYDPAT